MLALVFGGRVVFVKTLADDEKATQQLKNRSVIGLDCEWVPDFKPGADAPLSIVQVCDGESCYLWLLFQFRGVPTGLHSLITNESIVKVGCGMRGSDLYKLARSKLPVGPGIYVKKGAKLRYDLPAHFEDVQDYKIGPNKDEKAPFLGLDHLQGLYLRRRAPVAVKSTNAQWRFIEQRSKILYYAVTDAYAAFLIYQTYHENLDLIKTLFARDDATMRAFISDALSNQSNVALAAAIRAIAPFAADPTSELSEDIQELYHLQSRFFAARQVIETEEFKQPLGQPRPRPGNGQESRQPRAAAQPNAQPPNRNQQPRPKKKEGNQRPNQQATAVEARGDRSQMPNAPPAPSRQPSAQTAPKQRQPPKESGATTKAAKTPESTNTDASSTNQPLSERFGALEQNRPAKKPQQAQQPRNNQPKRTGKAPNAEGETQKAIQPKPASRRHTPNDVPDAARNDAPNGENHEGGNKGRNRRKPKPKAENGDAQRNGHHAAPSAAPASANASSAPN